MRMNIANLITLMRIALIPVFMSFFLLDQPYIAIILFSLAAITDGLDGYFARYLNQTSSLGAWLDPVADKLMVTSMLILLLADSQYHHLFIPTVIIVSREIIVSALREWMATMDARKAIRVSVLGKWKTAFQMLALFLFLLSKLHPHSDSILLYAYIVLYLATALTLLSIIDYIWKARKVIAYNSPMD